MKALTFLARRFVAGETAPEALKAVALLNSRSIRATVDILGENVHSEAEARRAGQDYIELLDAITTAGVDSNVSLKLTQMGLDISTELCFEVVEHIVKHAAGLDNFVRIDMESSAYTDRTLDIFHRLFKENPNVGIVVQAYLHRSMDDVEQLVALKAPVRLCKGAYKESTAICFRDMDQIRSNFCRLSEMLVQGGSHLAFGTHDEELIRWAETWIEKENLETRQIEFQMLYGLRRARGRGLAQGGHAVRSYVPFGRQWLPYFTRRLRERKENIFFVLKSLIVD